MIGPNVLRQVEPAANHGRRGRRVHRRGELTDGFTVGLLEQEPVLDDGLDVLGNIMQGSPRSTHSWPTTNH
ncbi:MAG: hypothetical protein M5U19_12535 [Microthrixaceae bacterium]|nr:hypothetical protein [Microthrixaceae bacterium]